MWYGIWGIYLRTFSIHIIGFRKTSPAGGGWDSDSTLCICVFNEHLWNTFFFMILSPGLVWKNQRFTDPGQQTWTNIFWSSDSSGIKATQLHNAAERHWVDSLIVFVGSSFQFIVWMSSESLKVSAFFTMCLSFPHKSWISQGCCPMNLTIDGFDSWLSGFNHKTGGSH